MAQYVNFNGRIINQDAFGLPLSNRAFRYGDGFFETIRCLGGKPLWADFHTKRMINSSHLLKMDLPQAILRDRLDSEIGRLLHHNGHLDAARVRLSLFRGGEGFYRPQSQQAEFTIESSPLDTMHYGLNKKGLTVGFYEDQKKQSNKYSGVKSSNALIYVMASLDAQNNGWDDILLLNDTGHVAEGSSSNVFMVDKGVLYTPSLDQGCVEGVMRNVMLQLMAQHQIKVIECSLLPDDLLGADEVFLTNTIRGIRWIKGIQKKRYYHDRSSELISLLNKAMPAL